MDFSPHLRDCSPVVSGRGLFPDEVIAYFMNMAGVDTSVPHVLRIIGMATQKFVSDVGTSAFQFCAEREKLSPEDSEARFTLNTEDLHEALQEYDDALSVAKRADYFA